MNSSFKFLQLLTALMFLVVIPGEKQGLCSLVDNHVTIETGSRENRYDNGYQKERYHLVLDEFIREFEGDIAKSGGSLHILRDWSDGAVNAWAWRLGREYWLEVPGGLSRYHLINEQGFLTTLCHEMGHLLGGSPHNQEISYEGQADYYSTMKCMERILSRLGMVGKQKTGACEGSFCEERMAGIKSLTSYYAELERVSPPSLSTPDVRVVSQTLRGHPGSQCRFDTMVAGLNCANREAFSYEKASIGSCDGIGARPRCWFSPAEFRERN